jgi:pimeloyl-ACP methyl ester carboxylesterase
MRIGLTYAVLLGVLLPAGFVKVATTHAHDADAPAVHKNVVYGMHCGLALLMDVYEPAESNGHALLFIAGSGWHWPTNYGAGGIKDAVASRGLGGGSPDVFADAGFTVFVINHRQAPLFRYPAAVDDARRAVRYVRHHGDEYGVTEEAIAAFGISSGAHLVLMLALGDGPGDPESADEVERHSSKVDVVAAFAGPSDLTAEGWAETIGSTAVTSFIGAPHWIAGGAHAEASPLTYVDGDDPPVLLIHGDADEVVPVGQARTLAARLREHQVEVEYVEIAGGGHDFDEVLNHDPNELPAFPAMARWLREHLPAPPPRDRFFDSAGVRIRYIDVGPRDGEPIVFVHGFTGSIDRARGGSGIIDALDDEHRVIALDLRGHGKSDKPHEPEKYGAEMAADVIRLLDHLHIERAHLIGYSLGAGIVFKLMADHPDRLLSAMPCGIGLRPQSAEEREFYQARASALEQAGRTGAARDESDAEAPLDRRMQGFVEAVSRGNDPAALAAVLRSVDDVMPDVSELEHNSVPSLSIFGEHDQVAGIAWTAERMANLDVKILDGANHFNAPGHPDFIPAIKAFVAQHARRDVEEDE